MFTSEGSLILLLRVSDSNVGLALASCPAQLGWYGGGDFLCSEVSLPPKRKRRGTDSNMPGLFFPNVPIKCTPFLL